MVVSFRLPLSWLKLRLKLKKGKIIPEVFNYRPNSGSFCLFVCPFVHLFVCVNVAASSSTSAFVAHLGPVLCRALEINLLFAPQQQYLVVEFVRFGGSN